MTKDELAKTWNRLPFYKKLSWFGGTNDRWKFLGVIAVSLLVLICIILSVWVAYIISVAFACLMIAIMISMGWEDGAKNFHSLMSNKDYQPSKKELDEAKALIAKKKATKEGAAAIQAKYPWLKKKKNKYDGCWTEINQDTWEIS